MGHSSQAVAIIGIGCRFPGGGHGPDRYWDVISRGTDCTSQVPSDRWSLERFYDANPAVPGKLRVARGGFLDQVDLFDPEFFGISPREADYLDPQQRLLLQTTWESFEDAGLAPGAFAGRDVGVFIGAFTLDYKILQFGGLSFDGIGVHTATGSMMTMVSNRISYIYDFRGPSVSLDTACSSSLVAVHSACLSLASGESELALAGGVMLMMAPQYTIAESRGGFLCPDGRCKAFAASANGYARGEGVGVVLLKPLERALADGDHVYAVIRGSGVNQDGHTNGITVPSGEQQVRLLERTYGRAGIQPAEVAYVEAHGTGTPVGDPVEANALGSFFSRGRPAEKPCIIGSVKTNIGHLESAAGVAGLIKAALCLERRSIPPHLHFDEPHPDIDPKALNIRIPTEQMPWPEGYDAALAGVNSFGFGGTNAHVVLERAPEQAGAATRPEAASEDTGEHAGENSSEHAVELRCAGSRRPVVLPFSARAAEAIGSVADSYGRWLDRLEPGLMVSRPFLHDLAFSLARKRQHLEHRLAAVAADASELRAILETVAEGEPHENAILGRRPGERRPKIVFVFTGMGPQWWAMGRQLLESEPVFRAAIERCDEALRPLAGWSMLEELTRDEASSRMAETQISQPANFAVQVGLVDLWRSWGIVPDAIMGHSAGEVAAFHAAGVYTFSDAVQVIYHRSVLQQRTAGQGKIAAVGLDEEQARELVRPYKGRVSIAAINSPRAMTIAGDGDCIEEIATDLESRDVFCRVLRVDIPFHSYHMDAITDELLAALEDIVARPAEVELYQTVDGVRTDGTELDGAYWVRNVRLPVRFTDAAFASMADGGEVFLEIGPHPVLTSSIRECAQDRDIRILTAHSLRRKDDEDLTMARALGALYVAGLEPDLETLYPAGSFLRLPTYPWQQVRCWAEEEPAQRFRVGADEHPLLGLRTSSAEPAWDARLGLHSHGYLRDHVIQGSLVFPAAGYIEIGLAAARQLSPGSSTLLEDLRFHKALFLAESAETRVQVAADPETARFKIWGAPSGPDNEPSLHASGKMRQIQPLSSDERVDIEAIKARCPRHLEQDACYEQLRTKGFHYGDAFRGMRDIWVGPTEALARVSAPLVGEPGSEEHGRHILHPTLLDPAFQILIAIELTKPEAEEQEVRLPVGIDRLTLTGTPVSEGWAHAWIESQDETTTRGSIRIYDAEGRQVVAVDGFVARSVEGQAGAVSVAAVDRWLYQVDWVEQPRGEVAAGASDSHESKLWLILAESGADGSCAGGSGEGLGQALAGQLEARGHETVVVERADRQDGGFSLSDDGRRGRVSATDTEAWSGLVAAVVERRGRPLGGVAHLWSLDARGVDALGPEVLDEDREPCAVSVLHLVQTLAAHGQSPTLWFVTRGACSVTSGDGLPEVAQAPIWGLGRVLGHQEHVGLWGGLVDLDREARPGAAPELLAAQVAALADELLGSDGEDQVALRGVPVVRRVHRLEPARGLFPPLPRQMRSDGAYMVTGAFGAIGTLVARWLVERGARHLVLLGRSPLPPRGQWGSLEADDKMTGRVRLVQDLEALGVTVHMATADVADRQEMADLLAGLRREGCPPIVGVFHSAGVVEDQLLLQMPVETFDRVYRPKVLGSWVLHEVLAGEPLEHFVLFSSVASLVTSTGQANYAAGNAFLDALALLRRRRGLPGSSLNWGPWAVGMVKELDLIEHYRRRGMESIAPGAGMAVLERVLALPHEQLAVVEADWPTVLTYYPRHPRSFAHLAAQGDGSEVGEDEVPVLQRLLAAEGAERQQIAEEALLDLVVKVLRVRRSGLEPSVSLGAVGIDSMLATELRNRIELTFGATVSVVDLLGETPIAELAGRLVSQLDGTPDLAERLAGDGELSQSELEQLLQTADQATVEELLSEVGDLDEAEVARLLNRDG